MFRSYIKIAWRNLLKSKAYSLINISGLAIGLACALAIGLFIQDEYSYDRFHHNAGDIYRVVQQQNQAGELYHVASSPGLMGETLKADFPEVLQSCLLGYKRSGLLQQGTITVESSAITMADTGFLKMFDFPLIVGNPDKVFTEPNQVVITDRMAVNLFGRDWMTDSQLLGKTIVYSRKQGEKGTQVDALILAGVVKEPPTNSHIQFEVVLTYDPKPEDNSNWNSNNFLTYIQLSHDANPADLNRKLDGYINKYFPVENRSFNPPVFYLQPLTDIYLHSDFDFQTDWTKTSSIIYVRIFFAVGIIVLLIAVFNFTNLSTARAIRRAKEVGIRKTIGAYRCQLMTQFLVESLLITVISVVIALLLTTIGLPFLNAVSSKSLTLPVTEINFAVALLLFIVIVSLMAGFYPSVYLSGFQPTKVLKGVFDIRSGRRFRHILVVTQFSFTVILVAGSIIIYKQLAFLRDKDLGFDKAQLIYVETDNLSKKQAQLLKLDLQKQSSIIGASSTSNGLIDVINSTVGFEWEGKLPEDKFLITRLNVDPWYLSTARMKLISGRTFNPEIPTDTTAYIINMSAARRMGWTSVEALGKSFTLYGTKGQIIGVVEDFHYRPMTAAIEPLVFSYMPSRYYSGIMVKAGPNQLRESIALIEELYKKYDPATSAHYSFVDEQLENQYQSEQRTGKVVFFFSMLAIFVACLGLYGLATFNAERRTKEIGIRKVMGASVASVGALLSKDFIFLIVLSIIIASPAGYFLMRSWLEVFVYRIELDWFFFAIAGSLPLPIAVLIVFYQAVVAARMDPVKSLRSE
ncbi:MAG TPA: FtsX-like permease family protein [Cyclobacteriaceae bacterium]|nr:FtsX-like permease family protein [Cyclobacteriaceae bacterium]